MGFIYRQVVNAHLLKGQQPVFALIALQSLHPRGNLVAQALGLLHIERFAVSAFSFV